MLCIGPVADHSAVRLFLQRCCPAHRCLWGHPEQHPSFLGVIFAHFLYGRADRMTPAKALGCGIGFAGVLIATLGNHGGGSARA